MASKTPARRFWGSTLPLSPLGATPRPHLRQMYPKLPEGSYVSEFQLNKSMERDYDKVKHTTTKTSYTVLRSQRNGLDKVDAPTDMDYNLPLPPVDVGSSTKSIIILVLIFFLSLLAVGWVYAGLTPQAKE